MAPRRGAYRLAKFRMSGLKSGCLPLEPVVPFLTGEAVLPSGHLRDRLCASRLLMEHALTGSALCPVRDMDKRFDVEYAAADAIWRLMAHTQAGCGLGLLGKDYRAKTHGAFPEHSEDTASGPLLRLGSACVAC